MFLGLCVFRCLDYLLDNGANPTLKNSKGYSAVHYAAAYGNKQHLELVSGIFLFPGFDFAFFCVLIHLLQARFKFSSFFFSHSFSSWKFLSTVWKKLKVIFQSVLCT